MKSKLGLAEIAFTLFAAAHLAACGSSSPKTGTGGATGTGGTAPTDGGVGGKATDGSATDGTTDTTVVTGPCTLPTGTTPAGTAGLQAAGAAVASTATRPQFDMTTADNQYTILKFLANFGSVASTFVSSGVTTTTVDALTPDNWDPVTNGIGDVSTFTPMFTVASDGSGSFTTVQAAITAARAVPTTTCTRIYILVKPGTYRATVVVPNKTSAPPITLYGSDPDASHTVLIFNNASNTIPTGGTAALGTSGSATFTNSSASFQAKNITFANDYTETGISNEQAVAFLNQGDRAQFENVRALGNQDTLYLKSVNAGTIARAYFRDSYFEGDTDFIFGRGTSVFDHCEIHTMGNSKITGTATGAPSTEVSNKYGFLYISSKFTADSNVTPGGTYLARQWYEGNRPQAVGKMIVRNSTIGAAHQPDDALAALGRPHDPGARARMVGASTPGTAAPRSRRRRREPSTPRPTTTS